MAHQCSCVKHVRCMCRGQKCKLCAHDPRHGSPNGYTNLDCRCDPCTGAHSVNLAYLKELRKARPIPDHVHGTPNGYVNYGCHCTPCTRAHTIDTVERRERSSRGETKVARGEMSAPKPRKQRLTNQKGEEVGQ